MGFCLGGHAALITSTLSEVDSTFDFYGAGIEITRPGGGSPGQEFVRTISGEFTCIVGTADPLTPIADCIAINKP